MLMAAFTLGSHIILVPLGVAFPFLVADRQLHRPEAERPGRDPTGASADRRSWPCCSRLVPSRARCCPSGWVRPGPGLTRYLGRTTNSVSRGTGGSSTSRVLANHQTRVLGWSQRRHDRAGTTRVSEGSAPAAGYRRGSNPGRGGALGLRNHRPKCRRSVAGSRWSARPAHVDSAVRLSERQQDRPSWEVAETQTQEADPRCTVYKARVQLCIAGQALPQPACPINTRSTWLLAQH